MFAKNINLKIIFILLIISLFYVVNSSVVFAAVPPWRRCDPAIPAEKDCDPLDGINYSCLPASNPATPFLCQPDAFGKIQPPDPLKKLLETDPTGTGVISMFLSNAVALIFSLAGVVLVLMIIWGAFDWMISEGEKEKVAAARNKIINAIIGIILFAIAFAIIRILGQFTGFTFFRERAQLIRDNSGTVTNFICPYDPSKIPFPLNILSTGEGVNSYCLKHGW